MAPTLDEQATARTGTTASDPSTAAAGASSDRPEWLRSVVPTLSLDDDAYTVTWPGVVGVSVDVSRLRWDRFGEITGDVAFSDDRTQRFASFAGAMLTSPRSRAEVLRAVSGQLPEREDWARFYDEAVELALDSFTAGSSDGPSSPFLRDAQPPTGEVELLPPLVLADHPTTWFGDGGAAKSLLALAAGLTIHTGDSLFGIQPSSTRRVAYLDWELSAWEHHERMRRLLGGRRLPDVAYRRCTGPIGLDLDGIRRFLDATRSEFIIVDSVGAACGAEPEAAATALGFHAVLRQLGVGALVIAHTNRAGDTERPFGSTYWHNGSRLTWHVGLRHTSSDRLVVAMTNRKANLGPLAGPIGFEVRFETERMTIARVEVDLALRPEPLKHRMLEAVLAGPLALGELAARLGAKQESVRKAFNRGLRENLFVEVRQDGVVKVAARDRNHDDAS